MKKSTLITYLIITISTFLLFASPALSEDILLIDSNGNVGIGTSSPEAKLHVYDQLNDTYEIIETDKANGEAVLQMQNDARAWSMRVDDTDKVIVRDGTAGQDRMTIDTSGNVGIGTTAPGAILEIAKDQANTNIYVSGYKTTDTSPAVRFQRARNTLASPAVVASGDKIGRIYFRGYDGDGWINSALILGEVDGTPGDNDMPGRLTFHTTADEAFTPTERMRIDSSGNVGIGTTSPATQLEIKDNSLPTLTINAAGATTSTPNIHFRSDRTVSGSGAGAIFFYNGATLGTSIAQISAETGTDPDTQGDLRLISSGGEIRLDENGNVGIGTASPAEKLDVNGNIAFTYGSGASRQLYASGGDPSGVPDQLYIIGSTVNYGNAQGGDVFIDGGYSKFNGGRGDVILGTKNDAVIGSGKISSNVGIGTTSPNGLLDLTWGGGQDVKGTLTLGADYGASTITDATAKTSSILQKKYDNAEDPFTFVYLVGGDGENRINIGGGIANQPAATNIRFTTGATDNTDLGTEAMRIDSSGNVGIGTTSPGYNLTVNGTAWVTSGSWSGSDIRWKRNISDLRNSLNKTLQLQGVSYEWKTEEYSNMGFDNKTHIGLIAQDTEKIIPEAVTTDDNGYKGISYEKLTAVLVEAIKELKSEKDTEIEELNSQIKALQEKIEELQKI